MADRGAPSTGEPSGSAFIQSFLRESRFLRSSFWDLALLSWIPLLLTAVIAAAFAPGVMRNLPVVVVTAEDSAISRELIRRIDASAGLRVAARTTAMPEAEHLVRAHAAYAVVLIPHETERLVLRGETAPLVVYYNASYSTASAAVLRDIGAVVQSHAASLAAEQSARLDPVRVRPPPIAARISLLFNPQGSYELQLVSLLHPALLHLIFMVAATSALGRELRDGTIGNWIAGRPWPDAVAAIAGKITVYLLAFTLWSLLLTAYLAGVRGWPVLGSLPVLLIGHAAMYLAYAGVALLVIGITLSMARALSAAGLYAGASFAFAGAIFPVESASAFAKVWSALLPYTAFAKLLAEQWLMGAPASASLVQIMVLLLFLLAGAAIGLPRYIRAATQPETWGRR